MHNGSSASMPIASPTYQRAHISGKRPMPKTLTSTAPTEAPSKGGISAPAQSTRTAECRLNSKSSRTRLMRNSIAAKIASLRLAGRNAVLIHRLSPYRRLAARLATAEQSRIAGHWRSGARSRAAVRIALGSQIAAMVAGWRDR